MNQAADRTGAGAPVVSRIVLSAAGEAVPAGLGERRICVHFNRDDAEGCAGSGFGPEHVRARRRLSDFTRKKTQVRTPGFRQRSAVRLKKLEDSQ